MGIVIAFDEPLLPVLNKLERIAHKLILKEIKKW